MKSAYDLGQAAFHKGLTRSSQCTDLAELMKVCKVVDKSMSVRAWCNGWRTQEANSA